jgi:PAS domain S-box-containing protein
MRREDMDGKIKLVDFIHPDDLPRLMDVFRDYMTHGNPIPSRHDFRLRVASGEYRNCICDVMEIPETKQSIASVLDVTDWKRTENELRRSERLFRSYFELPLVGIAITGTDRQWIQLNDKFCDLFGYTREELQSMRWANLIPPDEALEGEVFYRQILQENGIHSHVKRMIRKDGTAIIARVSGLAVRTPDGGIDYLITLVEDITAQRRAEEDKAKLEAQLRQAQKMEAIGTLAGGIAHDFNNILTSIYGFVELTMMVLPESSRAYDNLDHVLKGLDRARDLINQILAFSRQTEHEFKAIDIVPVVKETLKLLRASLPSTIAIENRVEVEGRYIMGDPTQIQQVLMNLCTNAHHAMKDTGGMLTVAVEPEVVGDRLAQRLGLLATGDYLRISVSDTGCGMDTHTQERIFDPFFTTKPVGEGTGLGLSIVHGIISAHNGAINVYSEPDVGTTFLLYFPVTSAEAEEVNKNEGTLPIGFGRILLVDDEAEIVQMTVQMLELLGYMPEAVNSSMEALARFQENPDAFDLLITDLTMPQMTGLDLSRLVHDLRPKLPIVLTTGFSEVLTPEQMKRLGIRITLMKPFDVWMLGNTLTEALAREE